MRVAAADRVNMAWLVEAAGDIAHLDVLVAELDKKIPPMLRRLGRTLTQEYEIAAVGAMDLLVEVGDPTRFATEAQSHVGAGWHRWRCPRARATRRPPITGSTWPATGR